MDYNDSEARLSTVFRYVLTYSLSLTTMVLTRTKRYKLVQNPNLAYKLSCDGLQDNTQLSIYLLAKFACARSYGYLKPTQISRTFSRWQTARNTL